jgi:hypothetical protein
MMRTLKLVILLSVIFYSCAYAGVPKDDRRRDDNQQNTTTFYEEGIVYNLPRNGFEVMVEVVKMTFIPGPYADYAKEYIGIVGVGKTAKTTWKLQSVDVDVFSEADPAAMFETNDSIVGAVSLLSNGIIGGINVPGADSGVEVLGNSLLIAEQLTTHSFTDLSSDNFYEILVDPNTGSETFKNKTTEVKAREAADYIMRLRQKRAYTILDPSDVVPEDGLAFKVLVEEIKRVEKEYVELFIGKTISSKHQMRYIFVPDENDVKNEVLFRFSEENGILPASNISGKPVFLNVVKNNISKKNAAALKASKNPNEGEHGLFYRIPISAEIEITDGMNTLFSGRVVVAQFGEIAPFPVNMLNDDTQIEYNTQTGTIKSISNK